MQQENEALLLRGKRAARFRRGEGRVTSSATRTSLCEGWLQPPSSQTRSLHRLYTKIMRGPAINILQTLLYNCNCAISDSVRTFSTRPPRYARFRRREESRMAIMRPISKMYKKLLIYFVTTHYTLCRMVTPSSSNHFPPPNQPVKPDFMALVASSLAFSSSAASSFNHFSPFSRISLSRVS